MFVRDITQMAQKAAPFLSYDADPYPVLSGGQIYWVLDAYTTSDDYPYAQNVNTTSLPVNSGLNQNFNYVRNSVKVVVNAYSGQMKLYDVTSLTKTKDPILETWEKGLPRHVHPRLADAGFAASASPLPRRPPHGAVGHLRRYHITSALPFYNATNAWNVSPSAGAGSPSSALPQTFSTSSQGQITAQLSRSAPEYEEFQVPGQSTQSFQPGGFLRPRVHGRSDPDHGRVIVAGSDPSDYGKLTVFQTPPIDGPALVDADISATQAISKQISLLNQSGSSVLLGTLQVVPIGDSMLYFRPFYVESTRNPSPGSTTTSSSTPARRGRARSPTTRPCSGLWRISSR